MPPTSSPLLHKRSVNFEAYRTFIIIGAIIIFIAAIGGWFWNLRSQRKFRARRQAAGCHCYDDMTMWSSSWRWRGNMCTCDRVIVINAAGPGGMQRQGGWEMGREGAPEPTREEYERANRRGDYQYYPRDGDLGSGLGNGYGYTQGNGRQQFPAGPVQVYTPMKADPSIIR